MNKQQEIMDYLISIGLEGFIGIAAMNDIFDKIGEILDE
jgi:23S rRNA maturation mini-RNase III